MVADWVLFGICWWIDVKQVTECKWVNNLPDTEKKGFGVLYVDSMHSVLFRNIRCTLNTIADMSEHWFCDFKSKFWKSPSHTEGQVFFFPPSLSERVFNVLHRQHGSSVTHNHYPATERREGRIHGMALPATFVTPVTSCRRHLINGVGCVCQRTSVLSHNNIPVCLCLHPYSPSPLPSPYHHHHLHLPLPSISTLSPSLLIATVWHWKMICREYSAVIC